MLTEVPTVTRTVRVYETFRIAWDDGAFWSGGWDSRQEVLDVLAGCDRAGHAEARRHEVTFDPDGPLIRMARPGIHEYDVQAPADTKPGQILQGEWERF
jgi:hypothetical protein